MILCKQSKRFHFLRVFVFLDPRPSAFEPRPSGSISSALRPQNIARLNTILLFNFAVVINLKL